MPSSNYYRRQAKILFSLSLVTSDAGVAGRLANLARHYQILAELESPPGAPRTEDTDHAQSGSIDPAS